VITSNRDIEEWAPLFGDALLASAAMDRLLHHAHIIDIEGASRTAILRARGARPRQPRPRNGSGLPNQRIDHVREHRDAPICQIRSAELNMITSAEP
jgi:hypothetical protein